MKCLQYVKSISIIYLHIKYSKIYPMIEGLTVVDGEEEGGGPEKEQQRRRAHQR